MKISDAMMGYLRVCVCGGMTKAQASRIQAAVEEAENLGYFAIAQAAETSEKQSHTEDDGCPTEMAVLKRFWRENQKPKPTFKEAWALLEARGFLYDQDAIEAVQLGFELARGELDQ